MVRYNSFSSGFNDLFIFYLNPYGNDPIWLTVCRWVGNHQLLLDQIFGCWDVKDTRQSGNTWMHQSSGHGWNTINSFNDKSKALSSPVPLNCIQLIRFSRRQYSFVPWPPGGFHFWDPLSLKFLEGFRVPRCVPNVLTLQSTNISPTVLPYPALLSGWVPLSPSPRTVGYEFVTGPRNKGRRVFECKGPTRRPETSLGRDRHSPISWRFVRGYDKPKHGSCDIWFPGGTCVYLYVYSIYISYLHM